MSGYPLLIGKTADLTELNLLSNLANRHGLITGATGTGKTVTLQKLAESFSQIGVPVFMADVKGDLSGIGAAGATGVVGGWGFASVSAILGTSEISSEADDSEPASE